MNKVKFSNRNIQARLVMRKAMSVCLAWLIFLPVISFGQTSKLLTNKEVAEMVKMGLSSEIIVSAIRAQESDFDISPTALGTLKRGGVPDSVLAAMIERKSSGSKPQSPSPTGERGMFEAPTQPGKGSIIPTDQPDQSQSVNLSLKRSGIPRIGIVTTIGSVPPEQDEAVRLQMYEMLYGNRETSSADAALLKEKLDRNILNEATVTGCDYVLYLSLDSTIRSITEKKSGGMVGGLLKGAGEALGIVNQNSPYYSDAARATYRGYRIANSLQQSSQLLDSITKATKKNDKVGLTFRLVAASGNGSVIGQTSVDRTAKKEKEPILQNVLIEVGNQILNSIPSSSKPIENSSYPNSPQKPIAKQSVPAVISGSNQPAYPVGKWTIVLEAQQLQRGFLTFESVGAELKGYILLEIAGRTEITNIKVTGNTLSFDVLDAFGANSSVGKFSGTFDSKLISGKLNGWPFTATPVR